MIKSWMMSYTQSLRVTDDPPSKELVSYQRMFYFWKPSSHL
jgi:hypothetical protein